MTLDVSASTLRKKLREESWPVLSPGECTTVIALLDSRDRLAGLLREAESPVRLLAQGYGDKLVYRDGTTMSLAALLKRIRAALKANP